MFNGLETGLTDLGDLKKEAENKQKLAVQTSSSFLDNFNNNQPDAHLFSTKEDLDSLFNSPTRISGSRSHNSDMSVNQNLNRNSYGVTQGFSGGATGVSSPGFNMQPAFGNNAGFGAMNQGFGGGVNNGYNANPGFGGNPNAGFSMQGGAGFGQQQHQFQQHQQQQQNPNYGMIHSIFLIFLIGFLIMKI